MKKVPFKDYDKFVLPFGIVLQDGKVVKDFALRPLTGRLRQKVLQASEKRSNIELLTNAVHALISRLGDLESPPRAYIEQLTTTDRDYVLFLSRYLQESTETLEGTCDGCSVKITAEADLEAVDIVVPEDADFVRQGKDWTYLFQDPEAGVANCLMRQRTVRDEEEAFRGGRDKVAYAPSFKLTAASILDFNGHGPVSEATIADLAVKTSDAFSVLFEKQQFGPDLTFIAVCDNCSAEKEFFLDVLTHFFGPGVRKGPRSTTAKS